MKVQFTIFLIGISIITFAQIKVNKIAVHVSKLKPSMEFDEKIVGLKSIEEPF